MKNDIFIDNDGKYNLNNLLNRNKMFQFEKEFSNDFLILYQKLFEFIAKYLKNDVNQQLI